jgi:crotonobetainyl-CoA:carnitine CoA-transferase CaiB-like acyl-CoA transferase
MDVIETASRQHNVDQVTPVQGSAPLAGLRVVEITSIYSGPLAGVLLAELGAEVIKVESNHRPDLIRNSTQGPHGLSTVFYALNRGKRFVSIDGSTVDGRALLVDLVCGADIFLHNMRTGKPEGIGLDYEELAKRNPRLIYAAISGLGTEGPDAHQPVYDYVIQARLGMVDYQRSITTGRSSLISQVLVDKTTAQATVQGILAALYVRERTGLGQRVDVPMLGAGLHFQWSDAMGPRFTEVNPAVDPKNLPAHFIQLPSAALLVIQGSDGGEIACSPALPPWDGFAIALDRPEWIVDDRFIDAATRAVFLPELLGEINAAAAMFTAEELLARFQENGVASGPVQRRWDVHNDRQIKALDLIVERDVEGLGTLRQPRPMWHFGESKALVTSSMGRTGEHTLDVLREAGLTEETIASLLASGAIAVPASLPD